MQVFSYVQRGFVDQSREAAQLTIAERPDHRFSG
jgi:hypothetical protein